MDAHRHDDYRRRDLSESCWPAFRDVPLEEITLGDALRRAADKAPDRAALIEGIPDDARRWSYGELATQAEAIARALGRRFSPGERVAFWAHNVPEWLPVFYGCAMAGLVLVTVNPAYRRRELLYVLAKSRAAGLFVNDSYRGRSLEQTARDATPDLPGLREIIPVRNVAALVAEGAGNGALPGVDPRGPVVIMFTSGTTGTQKGVIFHHTGVANMTLFTQSRGGLKEGGVFVNPMPMFHIGSLGHAGIGSVMLGATHVLMPEWDPEAYMQQVQRHRGTFSLLVPVMIDQLLDHPARPRYDLSSLRRLTSGASVVEPQLIRRTRDELGATISNIYGQTEMHGSITGTHPDDSDSDLAETIGQPLPHMELRIADPQTGRTLPLGEQGEIQTRGYQNMIGYFDMPEETAKTLLPDGWLRSGDLGRMDARGFVRITGRIKDMIIRGGENIYPREVELLLAETAGLAAVAVVGLPDPKWGEQVAAVLVPRRQDAPPDVDALFDLCRTELAHYKVPRFWYLADEMPMTETGKMQKFRLVEQILDGRLSLLRQF
ncbi:class I adenylate-forming enzyme family protein [Paracoccus sp. (in: a-proteobacteria)]|uniref:class I adenylate-forming enzyme family protein n=1 Tax=Paracoccus sp. TaxID=267 RepID=UPI003A8814F6